MSRAPFLDAALDEWRDRLGPESVLVGADVDRYSRSTAGYSRQVAAAVLPSSQEGVVETVRVAARHRVPLYPISTGRNWGYGCALPVVDGCVVVDLSRMRRLEIDEQFGLATVEPGVTQEQLWRELERQNLPYLAPVTGAGPSTSILGNALERGYGLTPYGDHFGAVTSLSAVLANGEVYRPALAALGGPKVDRLHKWGVGPYFDGLFTQSGLGIVTEMTIALAPQPAVIQAAVFELRDATALGQVVDEVRKILKRFPGVIGGVNLMNRRRLLSMTLPYPGRPGGVLAEEDVDRLARGLDLPPWLGLCGLYGEPEVVASVRRALRRSLRPHCRRLVLFGNRLASIASSLVSFLPRRWAGDLELRVRKMREALDILAGRPRETALPLAYWRSGTVPGEGITLDPTRDGCGLLWYAPLVPIASEFVEAYVDLVERVCPSFGIEPLITLTTVSSAAFDSTVPILFDPATEAEVAQACYRTLLEEGRRLGFVPYRLNVGSMGFYGEVEGASHLRAAEAVKAALDPYGIIAPGRYAAFV